MKLWRCYASSSSNLCLKYKARNENFCAIFIKIIFTKNIILHYNTTYWFDYQKNQLEDLEIEITPAFWLFLGHNLGRFEQYLAI
jgi:hypothetical protein